MMASTLGVDMVMTGHSLGRNKLEHLLASGQPLQWLQDLHHRRIEKIPHAGIGDQSQVARSIKE